MPYGRNGACESFLRNFRESSEKVLRSCLPTATKLAPLCARAYASASTHAASSRDMLDVSVCQGTEREPPLLKPTSVEPLVRA